MSDSDPSADSGTAPPGVQPERTALAWRRTALALSAGSLVAGRVVEPMTGPLIWVLAVAGTLGGLTLVRAGRRRAQRWAAVLAAEPTQPPGPGGRTLVLCAGGTLLLGLTALAVVLTH
ncbi:DUF202 domain-containing protein [Cellulomonas sp. NPDC089187]|uniref:DUF202 domain-containing protein n=1 Tax=Cellulomonas sp. NPDC089187 TaxID=3154970 RepID=UPI0034228FBD